MMAIESISQRMAREGFAGMAPDQQIEFATKIILEVRDVAQAANVGLCGQHNIEWC